jgi:orotate phosphoribosyltransferase
LIEGASVKGRRVVLLEDTVSTGESVLAAASELRAEGAELVRCVCIFTWGWQTTNAAFAAAALPLVWLTALPELLDAATAAGSLHAAQRSLVEAWVRDPQGWGAQH